MEVTESSFANVIVAFSLLSCFTLLFSSALRNLLLSRNWNNKKLQTNWKKILELRDAFLFFHEKIRNAKKIKSTMEADVYFFFKEKRLKDLAELVNLSEILICLL